MTLTRQSETFGIVAINVLNCPVNVISDISLGPLFLTVTRYDTQAYRHRRIRRHHITRSGWPLGSVQQRLHRRLARESSALLQGNDRGPGREDILLGVGIMHAGGVLSELAASPGHLADPRRQGNADLDCGPEAGELDQPARAPNPTDCLGVHRDFWRGANRTAQRAKGYDALEILRRTGGALSRVEGRCEPAIRSRREVLHLGGDHGGNRSRAGAHRRGFRCAGGTLRSARTGDVREAPWGTGAVFRALEISGRVHQPFCDLAAWMVGHLDKDLSVEALAERIHLCPRQFTRRFKDEFKSTPAAFVQRLRLDEARKRLAAADSTVEEIADSVGFRDPDSFRRAFVQQFGLAPTQYRSCFILTNDRRSTQLSCLDGWT